MIVLMILGGALGDGAVVIFGVAVGHCLCDGFLFGAAVGDPWRCRW